MLAPTERPQRAGEQEVLLRRRLVLLRHPLGGLDHDRRGGVCRVVAADGLAVRGQALGLGDGVEVAALVALDVDDHERLEPGAEPGRGPANPLGHGPDPPPFAGQQGDDAVGLTQLVGAQDDGLVDSRERSSTFSNTRSTARYAHGMAFTLQGSLLDLADTMTLGALHGGLTRRDLGDGAWVDVRPGWLAGADVLLETLLHDVPWRAERRQGRPITIRPTCSSKRRASIRS